MKIIGVVVAGAALMLFAGSGEARGRHYGYRGHRYSGGQLEAATARSSADLGADPDWTDGLLD